MFPVPQRSVFTALLIVGLLGTSPAAAQPEPPDPPGQTQREAVRATIDALFGGMRAGDSAAVRGLFAKGARIRSLDADESESEVETRTADAFAQSVGQPREAVWDERIWDVDIHVDGPMATARMPYVFYVDDERSHCGVNSFHLVRPNGEWRIQHITYTRRQDCTVPPEVQK